MPSVRAMHHVAMVTNDLDATKRFYCDFMGGKVVVEGHLFHWATGQCFIALGEGSMLEFFEFPDIETPDWTSMFLDDEMPKAGRLLEHVAYYVDTAEELASWREKVKDAGMKFHSPEGRDVIFFPDPNNATVQIIVGQPGTR
ncbi:MAG: VOC family protein [Thermomicrobiales bacterium]